MLQENINIQMTFYLMNYKAHYWCMNKSSNYQPNIEEQVLNASTQNHTIPKADRGRGWDKDKGINDHSNKQQQHQH